MISVDTSVLVRALVDDPGEPRQVASARAALRRAREVQISQIVQVETVWVLETAYGLPKAEILAVLEHLRGNVGFRLQQRALFEAALGEFRVGVADFADYLILGDSRAHKSKLLTFDKRLLKSSDTQSP